MNSQPINLSSQTKKPSARILSVFSLVMINIIAIDSLRSLPIGAEYGFSLVSYFAIAVIGYFIPIAMVSAELATGWPQTGGLYVWVRAAFGVRVALFAAWMQWIYNVVWYPTILALIVATLVYVVNPALANNKTFMVISVVVLFWLATWLNCLGMKISSAVSTLTALIGTLIPIAVIVALSAWWWLSDRPTTLVWNLHALLPNLTHINNLAFFSGVLYSLVGIEMSSVHAEEVKNPQRDYPKAMLLSALLIVGTLILGSLAIAVVVSPKELNLASGLIDAFGIFFKVHHLSWMIPVIALLIAFGGIGGVCAWVIGPTKALLVAARDGLLPKFCGQVNEVNAPVPLLVIQGVVLTVICTVFFLLPSVNSSFWLLSVMTAQLAMIMYVLIFAAAIRLRYIAPEQTRTFRVPGGNIGMWIAGLLGIITCVATLVIGFLPPPQINVGHIATYEALLIGGLVIFSLPPFLLRKMR